MELYIHIPFCIQKCHYCDFYSGPGTEEAMIRYVSELQKEMEESPFSGRKITSVFVGGGTPSVLETKLTEKIFESVYKNFSVETAAEITLECNPGTLIKEKCEAYKKIGINRISLGLQSDCDSVLKFLGRIHTRDDFSDSYNMVRKAGFENVSVDLISGLPGVSLSDFEKTLKFVTDLEPEHLSVYDLIPEEGTPLFKDYEKGKFKLPDEETDREIYHRTGDFLSQKGYERYEISNYARKGFESKHNVGYWTGEEYLGVGAAASSYVFQNSRFLRFRNARSLNYRELPMEECETLSKENRMSEFMILGLRMTRGVSDSEFQKKFSESFFEYYKGPVEKGLKEKTLAREEDRIYLTELGQDVANHVMCEFM